jgi:UDP-GlcNAc:undecaprenyl-phosphate GlcNAc-1-phosphate transferase
MIMAALATATLTYVLTPVARLVALKVHIIDRPGVRRVHLKPTPRAGGLAIYAAFWIGAAMSYKVLDLRLSAGISSLFWGSTTIVLIGLLDDKFNVRPVLKFAGQLLVAVFLVRRGHRIDFVTNPLGGMLYLGGWGTPLTVIWIVAFTNMVNFIDGLDGLAAGVSAIACVPLSVVALQMNRPGIALLTLILAGSAFGFLPHNFNPARIFMGDTGAMFLGLMLGVITVDGALKGAATIALTIPLLALGVPAFDTAFAVIRRISSGKPFYEADQGHLHHRLLALGLTQRQAVYTLYAISSVMGVGAVWALGMSERQAVALFAVVAAAAVFAAQRVGVLPSHSRRRVSAHMAGGPRESGR